MQKPVNARSAIWICRKSSSACVMRRIIKGILHRTWKPYVQWYLKSPRTYRWGDIRIVVEPEVFHPGFFFSTALLLRYLGRVPLHEKKVIEVGSGSGLMSLYCA